MAELFPELEPFRKDAVRLHPRRGEPTCRDSSVGGPLLWPADEPWPTCSDEDHDNPDGWCPDGPIPLVPVTQVYRADAPVVSFPEGCDLLQVLWCPFEHDYTEPRPQVFWRDSGTVGQVADPPADMPEDPADHLPTPCVVHPEPVTEYPSRDLPKDIKDALADRFARLEEDTGCVYDRDLADAPGTKLGGYPGWTQDPAWPDCDACGQRMDHLLTVASWEWDGATWRAWMPAEERELLRGQETIQTELNRSVNQAAGLMLGDVGGVYIFECRSCPGRPMKHWFDCS